MPAPTAFVLLGIAASVTTVADAFLYQTEGREQPKVLCLEDFTYQNVDDERDAEVWAWDSAFHSAAAIAGGVRSQVADVDLGRRREFWTWSVEREPTRPLICCRKADDGRAQPPASKTRYLPPR